MQHPCIIELQFFPCIYFFTLLAKIPVTIEAYEHYQKRSLRNKCIITGSQGPKILSVPLKKGKHNQQLITQVAISYDEPWETKHLRSLQTAYQSAPFFDHYFAEVENLYQDPGKYLFDFNWKILNYFLHLFELPLPSKSNGYERRACGSDTRGTVTARTFNHIRLPPYNQVFEDRHGYISNLSILDLLFCLGPETSVYLKHATGAVNLPRL